MQFQYLGWNHFPCKHPMTCRTGDVRRDFNFLLSGCCSQMDTFLCGSQETCEVYCPAEADDGCQELYLPLSY